MLRALLVSICIGALMGIVAILGARFGDTGLKVMVTSFAISAACALTMASFAAWELPSARLWSRAGAWASNAAVAALIAGIWAEHDGDTLWKVVACVGVVGIAGAHGSLISLARLPPRHQLVRSIALGNLALLASAIGGAFWIKDPGDEVFQLIGVLGVLDVAFTLAIGGLDYYNRTNLVGPETGARVAEVCFCPRCGRRLWYPAGEIRCNHCNAAFYIEVRAAQDLPAAVAKQVERP